MILKAATWVSEEIRTRLAARRRPDGMIYVYLAGSDSYIAARRWPENDPAFRGALAWAMRKPRRQAVYRPGMPWLLEEGV